MRIKTCIHAESSCENFFFLIPYDLYLFKNCFGLGQHAVRLMADIWLPNELSEAEKKKEKKMHQERSRSVF